MNIDDVYKADASEPWCARRTPGPCLRDLSEFITRQDDALVRSTAYYKREDDMALSFAYAALLPIGVAPKEKQAGSVTGSPGVLSGQNTSITWTCTPLKLDMPASSNCRFFTARGDVDSYSYGSGASMMERMMSAAAAHAASSELDYLILSGTNNNLYIELAVPCDLSIMEDPAYTPDMLRETPEYNRLVEASESLGIELCGS